MKNTLRLAAILLTLGLTPAVFAASGDFYCPILKVTIEPGSCTPVAGSLKCSYSSSTTSYDPSHPAPSTWSQDSCNNAEQCGMWSRVKPTTKQPLVVTGILDHVSVTASGVHCIYIVEGATTYENFAETDTNKGMPDWSAPGNKWKNDSIPNCDTGDISPEACPLKP